MSKVITFGNFKGGVGKTTASCMFAHIMSNQGAKVLVIDFDPQANCSKFLSNSYKVPLDNFTSVYEAIEQEDLSKAVLQLSDNLHILPSAVDLVGFNRLLRARSKKEEHEHYYLDFLLKPLKASYDYVIIDVPPTISEFTNNALVASDYTLIIMMTETDSFAGAIDFKNYAEEMKQFNPNLKIIGILPYLQNKSSKIDDYIITASKNEKFNIEGLLFDAHIYRRERIKRYRINGIQNEDHHDQEVHAMYEAAVKELLEKVEKNNDSLQSV